MSRAVLTASRLDEAAFIAASGAFKARDAYGPSTT
jgi:hypothetical protein